MAESECGAVGDVQASKEETATAMWRLFAKDVSIPSNGCLFLEKNRSLLHALEPSFAITGKWRRFLEEIRDLFGQDPKLYAQERWRVHDTLIATLGPDANPAMAEYASASCEKLVDMALQRLAQSLKEHAGVDMLCEPRSLELQKVIDRNPSMSQSARNPIPSEPMLDEVFLYREDYCDRVFLSIDLRSANFFSLWATNPHLVLEHAEWEELLEGLTTCRTIIESKPLRLAALGKLCSRKTTMVEHVIVNALVLDILGRTDLGFLEDCVDTFFRTSCDEVAFLLKRSVNLWESYERLKRCFKEAIPEYATYIRVESFALVKFGEPWKQVTSSEVPEESLDEDSPTVTKKKAKKAFRKARARLIKRLTLAGEEDRIPEAVARLRESKLAHIQALPSSCLPQVRSNRKSNGSSSSEVPSFAEQSKCGCIRCNLDASGSGESGKGDMMELKNIPVKNLPGAYIEVHQQRAAVKEYVVSLLADLGHSHM